MGQSLLPAPTLTPLLWLGPNLGKGRSELASSPGLEGSCVFCMLSLPSTAHVCVRMGHNPATRRLPQGLAQDRKSSPIDI